MASIVTLEIDNILIPLKVIKERRGNVRVSIGKSHAILRMPNYYFGDQIRTQIEWAKEWLRKQIYTDETLRAKFQGKDFLTGDHYRINGRNYYLQISSGNRKTNSGRLKNGLVDIKLNNQLNSFQRADVIQKLMSRIVGQDNLKYVTERIQILNEQYFQQDIKSVRLKNNSSNWGSCSSSGNLNISTRTLFAPPEVQDYVFIHELAHLIELNHSNRYWKLVRDVMPDYKEKEKWLKENNHLCDF